MQFIISAIMISLTQSAFVVDQENVGASNVDALGESTFFAKSMPKVSTKPKSGKELEAKFEFDFDLYNGNFTFSVNPLIRQMAVSLFFEDKVNQTVITATMNLTENRNHFLISGRGRFVNMTDMLKVNMTCQLDSESLSKSKSQLLDKILSNPLLTYLIIKPEFNKISTNEYHFKTKRFILVDCNIKTEYY